jgi:hypothetical protein
MSHSPTLRYRAISFLEYIHDGRPDPAVSDAVDALSEDSDVCEQVVTMLRRSDARREELSIAQKVPFTPIYHDATGELQSLDRTATGFDAGLELLTVAYRCAYLSAGSPDLPRHDLCLSDVRREQRAPGRLAQSGRLDDGHDSKRWSTSSPKAMPNPDVVHLLRIAMGLCSPAATACTQDI